MTKILITSALPYVNGVKHLGNLIGSLLPADVHARFRRQIGDDVLFICATDEHGTPAELGAIEAGQDVRAFCAAQHAIQADIYRRFGLSFDHFGRTSSPHNHALTQHFYRRLDDAGLIEARTSRQVFSPADRRFLPDRYVLGTCPHCGDAGARGDQCDHCGTLLDPPDLIDPRSALSGDRALEIRDSRHLYLRQSHLVEKIGAWIDSRTGWPPFVVSTAKGWLNAELRDRCITRDLAWGIAVPCEGFEGKVFYVWFDAPIGYIAATQEWADAAPGRDWRQWWWQADDVSYIQFLGKDNIPFHTVSFPATLIGSGEPWKTADVIKGFHWLNYEGGKFSTSRKRGVFTDAAIAELPADLWRWWLIANAPESADTDFGVARFVADVNKDLADIFGNLANRIISFAHRAFHGRFPEGGVPDDAERQLAHDLEQRIAALHRHHTALEFRAAAAATRAIWDTTNAYLQHAAPWTAIKSDPARAAVITRTGLNLVALSATLAWSIVPHLAARVLGALGRSDTVPRWPNGPLLPLLDRGAGTPVARLGPLVEKITPERAGQLTARFGA
ncbi:methionyl-tRNA synthetase [Bradyrhizobium japonicum]|uniref:Methionine--tRNA ligase n=1 Tax=Bradyrhizobium elkanii TaxID=29448 RepID=A0ABV4FCH1_BRAEL|nr:methionine--tRNA ligase [Bradyrhizobium elkanii]MBP2431945.1 methionyl-tRNA synthetase [Bradyrhizobium elkanii]MCP1734980.1 methionyl-tRNA synthetase [Bradyrhizobium elkanii]MCP1752526.1 methionyl-tRNA synthetase [Bradyrhizobium elkanii]MCP1978299.1 methionyl-tRNA synthetase [Bradyrhizobium elkanii]MCS3570319.1 methionyl-tRNA synthetase [Bradyrhizobium elkanii]